jgi:hypothetical protein
MYAVKEVEKPHERCNSNMGCTQGTVMSAESSWEWRTVAM